MSKWVRLTSDHRRPGGLIYFCKEGHEWFMSFTNLRNLASSDNVCAVCEAKDDTTQADTATNETL